MDNKTLDAVLAQKPAARKNPRETRVLIPAAEIDKLAAMFKGTSFSDAVQQAAIYGINNLYEQYQADKKDKTK